MSWNAKQCVGKKKKTEGREKGEISNLRPAREHLALHTICHFGYSRLVSGAQSHLASARSRKL